MANVNGDQGVPIERAKQTPGNDRSDIDAIFPQSVRAAPRIEQPANLLLAMAA
jgi:hypothetical protein